MAGDGDDDTAGAITSHSTSLSVVLAPTCTLAEPRGRLAQIRPIDVPVEKTKQKNKLVRLDHADLTLSRWLQDAAAPVRLSYDVDIGRLL